MKKLTKRLLAVLMGTTVALVSSGCAKTDKNLVGQAPTTGETQVSKDGETEVIFGIVQRVLLVKH